MNSAEQVKVLEINSKVNDICNKIVGEFCSYSGAENKAYEVSDMVKGKNYEVEPSSAISYLPEASAEETSVRADEVPAQPTYEPAPNAEESETDLEIQIREEKERMEQDGLLKPQEIVVEASGAGDSQNDLVSLDSLDQPETQPTAPETEKVEETAQSEDQPAQDGNTPIAEQIGEENSTQDASFEDEIAREMEQLKKEGLVQDSSQIEITKDESSGNDGMSIW